MIQYVPCVVGFMGAMLMCNAYVQCICAMLIIPCVICFQCMVQDIPGVATISRLLKIIGLFCKISSLL